MTSLARTRLLAAAALSLVAFGCDGVAPGRDGGEPDAGPDARVTWDAGPGCQSDEECDDGVACTADSCGADGVCRNGVIPTACDDGVFCNGVERCDVARGGCVPAEMRETCNDDDVCTIDRCDEEADTCRHFPRDLDGDGDPDWFCEGGGDCDDSNAGVSSLVAEVCDDLVDNDCDEIVDEPACGRPRYDLCDDPLDVSAGGFFLVNTVGATFDYAMSCGFGSRPDVVATFTLAEARSVEIEGEADFFSVVLSLRSTCDSSASEVSCESGFPATIRRRRLEPGTYFVVISSSTPGEIALDVSFGDPLPPVTNDTCDAPTDVSAGGTFMESFVEVGDQLTTRCGFSGSPDLVYTFTTTAEQDVRVTAQAPTGESLNWAIRSACADVGTEVRCVYGSPAAGRAHQLPAGTYFLILEGPSYRDVDFTLTVDFLPPTAPPTGDLCSDPLPLVAGTTYTGTFIDKQDDVEVSCGFRYRDAIHTFTLDAASDVTLELDGGSFANMALRTTCDSATSQLVCVTGDPARARLRGLGAGTYYVIAESSSGSGYTLRLDTTTPPSVTVPVTGNEACATAYDIPATGGVFTGSTTGMANDYTTSAASVCGSGAASPDAAFRLTLAARRRVVLSTEGSAYDTVLHVHRDACVSGAELYCDDDGGAGATSLLDRVLDAGTYYVIVDGFGTASSGSYVLDVLVTDPA